VKNINALITSMVSGNRSLTFYTALAGLMILIAVACTPKKETQRPWPEEYSRILRIGLLPEHNLFDQMERYQPLATYISEKTGIKIELKILSQYGNVINDFNSMHLDGAFFGSFSYALAHQRIALETMARPESEKGISTYHGMIFTRKDSGISSAVDMAGKRFAFVDKATTAGYLLPLKYFKDSGIQDYRNYFSETYFTGTHEDAVYDVLNGLADIGAAKNTVFYRLASHDQRIIEELKVLARSPEVPENALALRSDINPSVREKLKRLLLEMHKDPAGQKALLKLGAARFIETTNSDYKPVFEYAAAAGVDLNTYNWTEEQ